MRHAWVVLLWPVLAAAAEPDAYDRYVQAADAVVNEAALKQLHDDPPRQPDAGLDPFTGDPEIARKAELVAANAQALALVREGFALPVRRRFTNPDDTKLWQAMDAQLLRFPVLALLLRLDGQVHAAQGEWAEAVRCNLEAVRLGIDAPAFGLASWTYRRWPIHLQAGRDVWLLIPHLDEDEAREAARAAEALLAREVPYGEQYRQEFDPARMQASLDRALADGPFRAHYADNFPPAERPAVRRVLEETPRAKLVERWMVAWSWYADLLRGPFRALATADLPADPIFRGHYRADAPHWYTACLCQTTTSLIAASLALQAYREARHADPETLNALVPEYLAGVPVDAFTGQPLKYRREGKTAVVYSVGPDGVDDGGKALVLPEGVDAWGYGAGMVGRGDVVGVGG